MGTLSGRWPKSHRGQAFGVMDCTFGDVHKYDTMISSLYEIRQQEGESVEEYPDQITDQGKNLAQDRFYHGLTPSLQDALGFAMAELPEREQAGASFDMLYILAKKMEAWQPTHPHRSRSGSSDTYRDKYRRYPAHVGRVAMLEEEELLLPNPELPEFLPNPELPDSEAPKPDVIEGLSLRMIQAMNQYQREECRCFVCGVTDHFARDCPH